MAQDNNPQQPQTQPAAPAPQFSQADIDAAKAQARAEALAEAAAQPSDSSSAAVKKLKEGFKPAKGEEGYTHVAITHQHGQELVDENGNPAPQVKAFDPHTYETSISKQAGFRGEILHKGKAK